MHRIFRYFLIFGDSRLHMVWFQTFLNTSSLRIENCRTSNSWCSAEPRVAKPAKPNSHTFLRTSTSIIPDTFDQISWISYYLIKSIKTYHHSCSDVYFIIMGCIADQVLGLKAKSAEMVFMIAMYRGPSPQFSAFLFYGMSLECLKFLNC